MPTVDEQTRLKEAGAGFLSDMAKQSTGSGGVTLTNDQLKAAGAGFLSDMARQGGEVVAP